MKKIEVLIWGIEHIAINHGFHPGISEDEPYYYIWGGNNVPTRSDFEMLCDDLGLPRDYIESDDFGIGVNIPENWNGDEEYEVTGYEMWKTAKSKIGEAHPMPKEILYQGLN